MYVTVKELAQIIGMKTGKNPTTLHYVLRHRGVTPAKFQQTANKKGRASAWYDKEEALKALQDYRQLAKHAEVYKHKVLMFARRESVLSAAKKYSVSERTIYYWLKKNRRAEDKSCSLASPE
jgi:nitrogen regulatory protein PII-like uncharacterized protein